MQDPIDILFDNLDKWRHLPSYQLERRADAFFSAYLPEILALRLGKAPIAIIPEFPIHRRTIEEDFSKDLSFKVDYLAVIEVGGPVAFVELKTDSSSLNDEQDKYLETARLKGMPELLGGVRRLYAASRHKVKYDALLSQLEAAGLIGGRKAGDFKIVTANEPVHVLYIQPHAEDDDRSRIGFSQIVDCIAEHQDHLSRRFAESLIRWAEEDSAGDGHSGT